MNRHHLHLINAQLDGVITPKEAAELNELIKADPELANHYAEISILHDSLREGFQVGTLSARHHDTAPTPEKKSASSLARKILPFVPWTAAAAASIVAFIGPFSPSTAKTNHTHTTTAHTPAELHDSGFAVLTRVVEPAWGSQNSPTLSDFLTAGNYSLSSGLAQIEFLSGVSVVIEGDAEFEILSAEEMKLTRGKIRAHVPPPAIGFQIHTPKGTVLDLGTEFAIDLSEDQYELHVLDGEVEWYPNDEAQTLLQGGEAIRIKDDSSATIPSQPSHFTGPNQLAHQLGKSQKRRYLNWHQSSLALRQDPALTAYFPMEDLDPWIRELKPTQSHLAHGAIVAAEIVPGRWPGKFGLDFSPNGSRVRLNVPGEFDQITFATWARIDSLDRQFNALFLTDHYDTGEPHWQLLSNGSLFFSVSLGIESGRFHHIHESPVVWTHADSQQWLHLVTTYDCATRTATHYLNGEEISRTQAPEEKETPILRLGDAQIGNWGLPTENDPEFAIRNLNGSLDEFAIYSTALTPAQIKTLYQSGKP